MNRPSRQAWRAQMILAVLYAAGGLIAGGCRAHAGVLLTRGNCVAIADDGHLGVYAVVYDPANPPRITNRENVYRVLKLSPDLMVQSDEGEITTRAPIDGRVHIFSTSKALFVCAYWSSEFAYKDLYGVVWAKTEGGRFGRWESSHSPSQGIWRLTEAVRWFTSTDRVSGGTSIAIQTGISLATLARG